MKRDAGSVGMARVEAPPIDHPTAERVMPAPRYGRLDTVGAWMQTLAQSWLVYHLTGSALLLGAVNFVQGVPALFLSLVGGVLADRIERRRLMLVTQAAQMLLAFLLAGVTLAGVVRVEHIMIIAFLAGLVNAVNTPVRQGI